MDHENTVELPGSIRKVLESAGISVEPDSIGRNRTIHGDNSSGPDRQGCRIRMVLVGDAQGQAQVIGRYRDLVDLVRLNQELGRDLRLVPQKEQTRVRQQTGLWELPALPGLTGWPTYIDSAVFEADTLILDLAGSGTCLPLSADQFRQLAPRAEEHSFCVPLASLDINHERPEKDREQLHSAIQRFTGLRIRQRLDDTLEVPPLPETAQRIIHLRVNPNAVMGELVDIVESDPSLAAQVVSWASSSFYAGAGQVRSVHDAVSRVLGFELVMNLGMGLALGRALKQPEDNPRGFVGYWQQAIWQAQAAGTLASMMPRGQRPAFGLAYLAGLLHNFGYLVLAQVFPPHFRLACRNWEANTHVDASVVEHHLLGITREQLASELMANWGMPEEVTVAIRQQKNLNYTGDYETYAQLLWLGRQLLNEKGPNLGPREPIPDALYQKLGLDPDQVGEQMDELVAAKDSVMAMAGMMGGH